MGADRILMAEGLLAALVAVFLRCWLWGRYLLFSLLLPSIQPAPICIWQPLPLLFTSKIHVTQSKINTR